MPTILREKKVRFFFWSNETDGPWLHINAEKDAGYARLMIYPVAFSYYEDLSARERIQIHQLTKENEAFLLTGWNEFFK